MRITKSPEARKKEIIETAKKLFEKKGIQKTSMSEIAKEIGVAKGLVYYYFSSKAQLVEEVIEDFIKDVDRELFEIIGNDNLDFYSKLKGILNLYFDSIQNRPEIYSFSPENAGIFALIKERLSEIAFTHAKGLLEDGIKSGYIELKYPEYMLKIIISGLGDLYIEGVTDPIIHQRLLEQILNIEEGKL